MADDKVSNNAENEEVRILLGIIADEETTIGFLLAGIGESFGIFKRKHSFMMVKSDTNISHIQDFFSSLYRRHDMGIILVASDLFKYILPVMETLTHKALPIVLKIPTKSSMTGPLHLKEKEETKTAKKLTERKKEN